MAYQALISRQARRQLDAVPRTDCPGIYAELKGLAETPRPRGCVKVDDGIFRLRRGPWRVIYSVLDARETVLILKVARRSEKTCRESP